MFDIEFPAGYGFPYRIIIHIHTNPQDFLITFCYATVLKYTLSCVHDIANNGIGADF